MNDYTNAFLSEDTCAHSHPAGHLEGRIVSFGLFDDDLGVQWQWRGPAVPLRCTPSSCRPLRGTRVHLLSRLRARADDAFQRGEAT